MDATLLAEAIEELLDADTSAEVPLLDREVARTSSFGDAGVLTTNAGLVVRMSDGAEFQVTVVQSRSKED